MSLGVASSAAVAPSLELLNFLCEGIAPRDFAFRFWDGTIAGPDSGQPTRFTLVLNHHGSVRQMLWPFNKAAVGEAYIYDDIDIEGDIEAFIELLMQWRARRLSPMQKISILRKLLAMPNESRRNTDRGVKLSGGQRTESRDRQAIEYHYDIPGPFYAVFLDRYLQYTCGYFASPDEDIDPAQERKLEHVCRKLRLKPGERLIDFGCGWGGLITYAAKFHGVHSVGVTISKEQMKWAEGEIERMGVKDRCKLLFMDYRQVPESEKFDKAVSVGFIEHLGEKMMPTFFGKVWRLLRPNGLYLHHGITSKPFSVRPPWRAFALKYVFPDGELVPINNTIHRLVESGFEVRDVESLREHYIYTLDRWRQRLEARHDEAVRLADEVTYRIFRIYFAGAKRGFRKALYNLHQTLVVKAEDRETDLPLSRADLYR
jgi:cyclopropane-fatty-acyl-phospholipid synthase